MHIFPTCFDFLRISGSGLGSSETRAKVQEPSLRVRARVSVLPLGIKVLVLDLASGFRISLRLPSRLLARCWQISSLMEVVRLWLNY